MLTVATCPTPLPSVSNGSIGIYNENVFIPKWPSLFHLVCLLQIVSIRNCWSRSAPLMRKISFSRQRSRARWGSRHHMHAQAFRADERTCCSRARDAAWPTFVLMVMSGRVGVQVISCTADRRHWSAVVRLAKRVVPWEDRCVGALFSGEDCLILGDESHRRQRTLSILHEVDTEDLGWRCGCIPGLQKEPLRPLRSNFMKEIVGTYGGNLTLLSSLPQLYPGTSL